MESPQTEYRTIIDKQGVDPRRVPQKRLRSEAEMPAIGLGTFGSDHVSGEAVAEAVLGTARVRYRHFDCVAVYGNEQHIGTSNMTNSKLKLLFLSCGKYSLFGISQGVHTYLKIHDVPHIWRNSLYHFE